MGTGSI